MIMSLIYIHNKLQQRGASRESGRNHKDCRKEPESKIGSLLPWVRSCRVDFLLYHAAPFIVSVLRENPALAQSKWLHWCRVYLGRIQYPTFLLHIGGAVSLIDIQYCMTGGKWYKGSKTPQGILITGYTSVQGKLQTIISCKVLIMNNGWEITVGIAAYITWKWIIISASLSLSVCNYSSGPQEYSHEMYLYVKWIMRYAPLYSF